MSDDPHYILSSGVDRIVHQLLYAEHGNDAVVQRPISSTIDLKHSQPANYLHGIAAAQRVLFTARGQVVDYALKARGEGVSWRDLASVLDLDIDPEYDDVAIAAFREIAPRPSMPFDEVSARWTCSSCGQRIKDLGPFNGSPAEDEEGHADDCRRQTAAIASQRARWDADE